MTFSDDNTMKHTASGGIDGWDRNKYLNIWVCNLGNSLLGYAEYPGGPASTDGVVILYSAFGTGGVAAPPYNLGRTATHEVGHWLNLIHIWGDDIMVLVQVPTRFQILQIRQAKITAVHHTRILTHASLILRA